MNDAILILRNCIAMGVLWAFWQYGWKAYAVDLLRQSIFPVRNTLFDMAMNKEFGLEFNSPAYIALRESFNSRIRFAHRVSFTYGWIGMLICKLSGLKLKSFKPKVDAEIEAVTNEQLKEKLKDLQCQGDFLFLRHMLLISPFLWLMLLGCLWYAFCRFFIFDSLVSAPKKAWQFVRAKGLADSRRVVSFQADCDDDFPQGELPIAV